MNSITLAPDRRTTDEDEEFGFLTADYETPVDGEQPDAEEQLARCDAQILAALVTF